jgi:hypothetical protein
MKINNKLKGKSLKLWFLTFLFSLSTFHTFAQDSIVVKGTFVGNTKYAKVLMKKFEVGNFPVGGATIKNDSFKLVLPPQIDIVKGINPIHTQFVGANGKYLVTVKTSDGVYSDYTVILNR